MSNFVQREDRLFDPVTGAYVGYINLSGQEVLLSVGGGGGSPGGSTTQLQYNNAGSFGGMAGWVYNSATGALTAPAKITNTVGIGTSRERAASASLNSVRWAEIVNQNPYTDGSGVGGANYNNEVTAIGWNLSDTIGTSASAGTPAIWDNWEYKYNIAGKYHHERHMEMVDTAGARHRFFSFAVPHDGGGASSHLIACDVIAWLQFNAAVATVQWNLLAGNADFGTSAAAFTLRFAKNNSAPLVQRNAADSAFLSLPYYNATDVLLFGGQELHNVSGTIAASGTGLSYSFSGVSSYGASANMVAFTGVNVTSKDVGALLLQASTNFLFYNTLQNTHASGRAQYIAMSGASGSASYKVTNNTTSFVHGMNTAGNWFLGSDEFASDDVMRVNKTNREVLFIKPPRRPQPVAVASLPAAATYPWGAATVNDATMTHALGVGTIVVGGGANSLPVYSDGTNWRIG